MNEINERKVDVHTWKTKRRYNKSEVRCLTLEIITNGFIQDNESVINHKFKLK